MKKFLLNGLFFGIGFFFIIGVAFFFVNASNLSKSDGDTLSRDNRNELVSRVEILESYHVKHYTCTGSIPSNATLCDDDEKTLTSDTTRTAVNSCTEDKKCEYKCDSGASQYGNSCIYQCTGAVPDNAILCDDDEKDLSSAEPRLVVPNCSDDKCEYKCKPGMYNVLGVCSHCPQGQRYVEYNGGMLCCPDNKVNGSSCLQVAAT